VKHKIKSKTHKDIEYEVEIWSGEGGIEYRCTCPDNQYRNNKCKHIREAIKIEEKNKMEEQPEVVDSTESTLPAVKVAENQLSENQPSTLDEEFRNAKMLVQSGLLPKQFNTEQKVMTAYRFAKETGLPPLTAMRQMAVINGTPSFYGDLPLSTVMNSGKLESIKEYLIDSDYQEICTSNKNLGTPPWAAICIVKRKNDPEALERTFTMEDAKAAGLQKNAVWGKYRARMLTYRARGAALKDKFPDCLNGVNIAEYDNHVTVIDGNVIQDTTSQDKTKDLNDKFS